jgi:RNA polymerase sigma-70 factor (TIGR02943 family)
MDTPNLSFWVEEFTDELYQRARYKVTDPHLAKDLVQDTFMAAAEGVENFRNDSSPKTWLFSILNRKIIDHYRSRYKQPVSMDSNSFSLFFNEEGEWNRDKMPSDWGNDEVHLLDNEEFMSVLKACFDLLPDKWSSCMKLKYFMDKKGEEICQELGITPSNLWQMMHRAKLKLRDCVESNWL